MFTQTKLIKEEWNNLEVPIEGKEYEIIRLIHEAGSNINTSIIRHYHY